MENIIASTVSVRLTPKCRDSVELISKNTNKNQIRLINRNSNDFTLFQFNQIYNKQATNIQLFQEIFQQQNVLIEGESTVLCFLGSSGTGKTYSIAGEMNNFSNNSGMLYFLMQSLLPNPKQLNLNSNSIQFRFLQVLGDSIQNIGFQMVYGQSKNQREQQNRIDYKIDIKSFSHFQSCINKVYQRKKPHMHLIIEITIKSQASIYTPKKSMITMVELSSAAYDQGNIYYQKLKSEIEALIMIFQNIPRIKQLQHLFQGSKLTKTIKNNFFQAKKIHLIGILDNSYKGNIMTLKWLQAALQLKEDKAIIENVKEQIKKEEQFMKGLIQKHKKVMTLLSKCIGSELSFFQKQKNLSNKKALQLNFGNNFNKRCQKIKMANLKKQQNQQEIQNLNRYIQTQKQEIQKFQQKFKTDLQILQDQRYQILSQKNKLVAKLQDFNCLPCKFTSYGNNSVFWRPNIEFNKKNDESGDQKQNQKKQVPQPSKQSSFKASLKRINSNGFGSNNLKPMKIQRKKHEPMKQNLLLQVQRQKRIQNNQVKRQIYQMFLLIQKQEKFIQNLIKQNNPQIPVKIMNKMKTRKELLDLNISELNHVLKEGKDIELYQYQNLIQNRKVHLKFQRDLQKKQKKTIQSIKN